ncbi:MAG: YigZ family protein [Clostridia bacterium]|nr:YigZ family protein [Clostridia bacterium]
MTDYLTIKNESVFETVIKRSKFIARSFFIADESEAAQKLKQIRAEYPSASHYCYAYVLQNDVTKQSDDKEPNKTAGYPILEAIKQSGLFYTMVAVTRYFGGVKLGTGGLSRAYHDSALNVLNISKVNKFIYSTVFDITADYPQADTLCNLIENSGKLISRQFDSKVTITAACAEQNFLNVKNNILDLTAGSAIIKERQKEYIAY